jgi:hypothetical protein
MSHLSHICSWCETVNHIKTPLPWLTLRDKYISNRVQLSRLHAATTDTTTTAPSTCPASAAEDLAKRDRGRAVHMRKLSAQHSSTWSLLAVRHRALRISVTWHKPKRHTVHFDTCERSSACLWAATFSQYESMYEWSLSIPDLCSSQHNLILIRRDTRVKAFLYPWLRLFLTSSAWNCNYSDDDVQEKFLSNIGLTVWW